MLYLIYYIIYIYIILDIRYYILYIIYYILYIIYYIFYIIYYIIHSLVQPTLTGAAELERLKVQLGLHLPLEDGLQAPLDASKPHFKANLDSTWPSKPASERNLAVQLGL